MNVNMLKMLVKVKIEQNDNISFHEYPVDEIRFMRGNVVMGKENLGEEDDDGDELPEEVGEGEPAAVPAINTDKFKGERPQRQNERGGRDNRKDGNRNRNGNRGGRPDGNNNPENVQNGGERRHGNGKKRHGNRGNGRREERNPTEKQEN